MTLRLDAARNGEDVVFRTRFSEKFDLVQVMRGMVSTPFANHPVDFRLAGLQRHSHRDIWHVDRVLAFSTDECTPMVIHGEDIGGNHGHPGAVRLMIPGHGLDSCSVGTRWVDETGLGWTLLRVESAEALLFLSDNVGSSVLDYAFARAVTGMLCCVDRQTAPLRPVRQVGGVQLVPAIRHLQREAVALREGTWQEITGEVTGCERAEIREVYEIVNPATVAQTLRANRPQGGYAFQPSLAVGEAMMRHQMTYRIEPDGTILCDFAHTMLQDVPMTCYLGVMHQEKCDAFGGGLWRYIPKLMPFEDHGRRVDFTRPYRTTAETVPDWRPLTPDLWAQSDAPPDRQLDFLRDADGTDAVGFACGFLPLYDGAPERRRGSLTDAGMLAASCKTYPTFAGGSKCTRSFPELRGVAYRKYFQPAGDGRSLCTIPCGGDTYVYMDFFADAPVRISCPVLPQQQVWPLEATVPWQQTEVELAAEDAAGYAVFCLRSPEGKG